MEIGGDSVVIDLLLIVLLYEVFVRFVVWSYFCHVVLSVFSCFVIILMT